MHPLGKSVILVAGATDGIGRQTALELARRGAAVIIHGRKPERVERARSLISESVPGARTSGVVFDLASFASVREAAATLPRLTTLINNAGIFASQPHRTVDGHDETMQVNHLSHYLLTRLLLDRLEPPARIINVSSQVHSSGKIELDDLDMSRHWSSYGAYAASKLANVLFTRALARRLDPAAVTVNALHPGVIATKLLREGFGMGGATLDSGARTSLKLATDASLDGVTGRYFSNEREATPSRSAQDDELAEGLWQKSAELVGLGA